MRTRTASAFFVLAVLAVGCGDDDEETSPTTTPTTEMTSEAETTTSPTEADDEDGDVDEADGGGAVAADSPGAEPETALEAFFVSGDPDLVCGELATEKLLSAAYGDEKGCRQAQVPAAVPEAIDIKSLDVSGEEAKATVIPDGGPNDGIETEVVLVNPGDGWLVDSLEADVPAGP